MIYARAKTEKKARRLALNRGRSKVQYLPDPRYPDYPWAVVQK